MVRYSKYHVREVMHVPQSCVQFLGFKILVRVENMTRIARKIEPQSIQPRFKTQIEPILVASVRLRRKGRRVEKVEEGTPLRELAEASGNVADALGGRIRVVYGMRNFRMNRGGRSWSTEEGSTAGDIMLPLGAIRSAIDNMLVNFKGLLKVASVVVCITNVSPHG